MDTGFCSENTDPEFARRSAAYLAANGYGPREIRLVLLEELQLPTRYADDIISALAA